MKNITESKTKFINISQRGVVAGVGIEPTTLGL